jgi:hypothetical protein
MISRLRKLPIAVLVAAAALALGACGESHSQVTTGTYAGESGQNAPYLNVGPLVYEVQLSRQLNPANVEDAAYLQGVPAGEQKLEQGEEWFGVFLQVYNHTGEEQPLAHEITISDTQNNLYTPLALGETNAYAYRAEAKVAAENQVPVADTTAALGPTGGMLLLYKIKVVSLDNRPLEIKIVDPTDPSKYAQAELDV